MSAPEFDPYSNDYKSLVNESLAFSGLDVDYFTRVKAEYLKDILLKTFGKTDVDVLDLGCGIGNYHTLLRPALRSLRGRGLCALLAGLLVHVCLLRRLRGHLTLPPARTFQKRVAKPFRGLPRRGCDGRPRPY